MEPGEEDGYSMTAAKPDIGPDVEKRRFLVACVALSGLAATPLGPAVFRAGKAWAQAGGITEPETLQAMVRVARRLYPHDAVADEVYAEVLGLALASTASDPSLQERLAEAHAVLNGQQVADFLDLDEQTQIAAMRAIEQMDFFSAIQGAVRVNLYKHPRVWEHLGYEGPSDAQGGYLNRGAGELDWLEPNG